MTSATFLTTRQLAERLGYHPKTLRSWRKRGHGPSWIKASPRRVIYDLRDVEAWEAANREEPPR